MDEDALKDANEIINFYRPYFRQNVSDLEKGKSRFYIPICPIMVIKRLCEAAKNIFMNEPMLLRLYHPVVIVGDLHGHILDLFRHFGKIGIPTDRTFLFLGDIVDRGEFSTECITLILALKLVYPDNIYVIRGNHEFVEMSRQCGFTNELNSLYTGDPTAEAAFMDAFSYIPIGALIGPQVLCVHGGLGPQIYNVDQLDQISRPLTDYNSDIVASLLWSDPSRFGTEYEPSTRGLGYFFGPEAIQEFLTKNELKYLVRGHECVENGVEMQLGRRMFTVFGASNYCGLSPNKAGALIMKPDVTREVILFNPITHPKRGTAIFLNSESPKEFVVRRPGGFTGALINQSGLNSSTLNANQNESKRNLSSFKKNQQNPSNDRLNKPSNIGNKGNRSIGNVLSAGNLSSNVGICPKLPNKLPQLHDSPNTGSRLDSRQQQKRCNTEMKQKMLPRRVSTIITSKRLNYSNLPS
ncbi:Ser/Thr protein phosphatase [Tritrichomonas foetus]|uniref:Serine/threonine-protein phosphatase n=1 Tax=Tritrichomonas foetus TaxID=1144522 RepID=A0A1J4JSU9_9EUKA|nr:Ser/Thr protein phosphatase [Tritrichomonas foetus]|eukprot:OHT02185.1 Ser/Thr protein phosphatase [Tritrichomonas foetus]